MDAEIGKNFQRGLKKQGMKFKLSTKVTSAKASGSGVRLTLEQAKGGKSEELECDVLLVAVGRKPYTEGLGLEEVGVELDERGRVKVGKGWETSVSGIYAIGDVIEGPMLAHKAEEEGVAVAEMLAGQPPFNGPTAQAILSAKRGHGEKILRGRLVQSVRELVSMRGARIQLRRSSGAFLGEALDQFAASFTSPLPV